MYNTYQIRCYFDLKFGFSASKYTGIKWSPNKFLTFFVFGVAVEFIFNYFGNYLAFIISFY